MKNERREGKKGGRMKEDGKGKKKREERKRGREGEKQLLNIIFPVKTFAKVLNNQTKLILFSWAPKSLQMVTAAMKLKDSCSLEEKL